MATVPSIGRANTGSSHLPNEAVDATRDLYERYGPQIYKFCLRELGSREEAEDATQTTFLNAFRGLDRGVSLEFESAWLYTIAHRVCVSRQRSSFRRRRLEAPDVLDDVQELVPAVQGDTDELFGLRDALAALPEQQRRALLLREWQGLSCKEIAGELGLTPTAVEMLLFRARRGMVEELTTLPGDSRRQRLRAKLRTSGDAGSLIAALKTLLFSGGVKMAATLATVAATSVVAATPATRHVITHQIADIVAGVPSLAPKPKHVAPKPTQPVPKPSQHRTVPVVVRPLPAKHVTVSRRPQPKHVVSRVHAAATREHAPAVRHVVAAPVVAATGPAPTQSAPAAAPVVVPPVTGQPTTTTTTTATTTTAAAPVAPPADQPAPAQKPAAAVAAPAAPAGPPTAGDLSPTSGPPGTIVTVAGTNLKGTSSVAFNGTAAQFTVDGDQQLRTKVPDGATTGPITVTTPAGSATTAGSFTVTSAPSKLSSPPPPASSSAPSPAPPPGPAVGDLSPASGSPGTTVSISGSHFTGATGVRFNGVPADFTVVSDTQITARVPAAATSGPVQVGTPAGIAASSGSFTVVPASPSVSGISPASGPVGTIVSIGGAHLAGTSSVKFGDVVAQFTVTSDSQLQARVPDGAASGTVTVTGPNGSATTSFTVAAAARSLTGFTPSSGATGSTVNIGGSHLGGTTSVTFNGVSAKFTVVSDTQVTAQVPDSATSGPIAVTTPGGTATSPSSFSVSAPAAPPTIAGFTPSGGAAGTIVTITGTHLGGATEVAIGGVAAKFTVDNDGELKAQAPTGVRSGPVTVTTPAGTATSSAAYTAP